LRAIGIIPHKIDNKPVPRKVDIRKNGKHIPPVANDVNFNVDESTSLKCPGI
jgi:hypothetical protein